MPTLHIDDQEPCDVDDGKRLVNAITDCGVDVGHRCGGQANCTTCRVRFREGEPDVMTRAEHEKLDQVRQDGETWRLSCQIKADCSMRVETVYRANEQDWDDAGPRPAPQVEPETEWFDREALAGDSY